MAHRKLAPPVKARLESGCWAERSDAQSTLERLPSVV